MKNIAKYTDNDIDEDMKLTHGDYVKILHHYQESDRGHGHGRLTRKNSKSVKERAHRILAQKLCRCIKAGASGSDTNDLSAGDEGRRIGYCTRSIFNSKGLRSHGFQCKTKTGKLRPKMTRDITKKSRRIYK